MDRLPKAALDIVTRKQGRYILRKSDSGQKVEDSSVHSDRELRDGTGRSRQTFDRI